MSYSPDSILDAIETFLADGLRRDATATRHPESTARVLLAPVSYTHLTLPTSDLV